MGWASTIMTETGIVEMGDQYTLFRTEEVSSVCISLIAPSSANTIEEELGKNMNPLIGLHVVLFHYCLQ